MMVRRPLVAIVEPDKSNDDIPRHESLGTIVLIASLLLPSTALCQLAASVLPGSLCRNRLWA